MYNILLYYSYWYMYLCLGVEHGLDWNNSTESSSKTVHGILFHSIFFPLLYLIFFFLFVPLCYNVRMGYRVRTCTVPGLRYIITMCRPVRITEM